MNRYEYHCVSAPAALVVNKYTDRDKAVKAYENIINQTAAEGWEYVGMDSYTTQIKPGCLNWNTKATQESHRMLVFRRLIGE